uniref:LLM class flavin-dependent oxidoreductase n=1 Tax=Streptomyces galilaeus TaxID=33899 RepID=UPI0038F5EF82
EMWILGSSLFGAQLAAMLGLPYAFASHFAPDHLDAALTLYRERFTPSATLDRPHVMAAINVLAAPTDEEAVLLASSMDQSFVRLRS